MVGANHINEKVALASNPASLFPLPIFHLALVKTCTEINQKEYRSIVRVIEWEAMHEAIENRFVTFTTSERLN